MQENRTKFLLVKEEYFIEKFIRRQRYYFQFIEVYSTYWQLAGNQ